MLGKIEVNPAFAIAEIIIELEKSGATVVAIPCNTAHSPRILDVVQAKLKSANCSVKLLNMIAETVAFIKELYGVINVGVISRAGTKSEGLCRNVLIQEGMVPIEPADTMQEAIHSAIYDKEYGIKANLVIVSERSRHIILSAIEALIDKGANAIILGCTELPIAIPQKEMHGIPLIDPNRITARALIKEMDMEKLTTL